MDAEPEFAVNIKQNKQVLKIHNAGIWYRTITNDALITVPHFIDALPNN